MTKEELTEPGPNIDLTPIETAALAKVLPEIVRALKAMSNIQAEKEALVGSGVFYGFHRLEEAKSDFSESVANLERACRS